MEWEGVAAIAAIVIGVGNFVFTWASTVTSVRVKIADATDTRVVVAVRNRGLRPVVVTALRFERPNSATVWDPSVGVFPALPLTINGRGVRRLTIDADVEGQQTDRPPHGHVIKAATILRQNGCDFIVELDDGQQFRTGMHRIDERPARRKITRVGDSAM